MKWVMPGVLIAVKPVAAALALVTAIAAGGAVSVVAHAADAGTEKAPVAGEAKVEPLVAKAILARLSQGRPDLQFGEVKVSPLPGMYQVDVMQGPTLYVSQDGSHFIAGDLFRVADEGYVNVRELQREEDRVTILAKIPRDELIIFPALGETKAFVTVFTDIDCGYCVKLHREVPKLNEMGIEVRYMAYPRAGLDSPSYQKIATAWCSDTPAETLTRLKNRERVEMNVCKDNPVAAQFALGNELGVRGTPALITEQGVLLPGYMPADQLAAALGVTPAPIGQ